VIRLVATDLDGTFWDGDLSIPNAHLAAAGSLMHVGVTVLVATSRRPRIVRRQLAAAGLSLPAVLLDGALGIDFRSDVRFHRAVFDPEVTQRALATFSRFGLQPCLYVEHPDFDIVVSESPSTCAEHLAYLGSIAATGDLQATAATTGVYAMSILGLRRERLSGAAHALREVGEVLLYPEPDYGQFGLIVNPRGISKWSGVLAYCRLHGIGSGQVLAVGDGLNDVSMLQQAGLAVGVRGGVPEATSICEHLIEPPELGGWTKIVELVEATLTS
jgi:hydroxymethylpyrimidine pyrophosphatase-like HAD family hydrolase